MGLISQLHLVWLGHPKTFARKSKCICRQCITLYTTFLVEDMFSEQVLLCLSKQTVATHTYQCHAAELTSQFISRFSRLFTSATDSQVGEYYDFSEPAYSKGQQDNRVFVVSWVHDHALLFDTAREVWLASREQRSIYSILFARSIFKLALKERPKRTKTHGTYGWLLRFSFSRSLVPSPWAFSNVSRFQLWKSAHFFAIESENTSEVMLETKSCFCSQWRSPIFMTLRTADTVNDNWIVSMFILANLTRERHQF